MPLIITQVIPYMHPHAGGPPVVVDRLCRRLAARDWEVEVITTDSLAPRSDVAWARDFENAGYRLTVCPTWGPGGFAYSPCLKSELRRAISKSNIVHLHTMWTYPTMAAASVSRKLGVPYVVMPHGMIDPHSLKRKWLKKKLVGWALEWPRLRRSAGMVYTNDEERQLAEAAVSRLPDAHIVPLAADEPPAEPRSQLAEEFLARWPELRGQRLVVFLSRLHSKKGLDLLIPACAALMRSRSDVQLVLAGPGEDGYVESLRELARHSGIAGRVTFTGALSGRLKWSVLAAGAVFALPSYQENFAIVVAEAMQVGLPVVLSRRVNIWKDVTEAGAGLACELDSASAASALGRFLDDPALSERAGQAGQRLARSKFTWELTAEACEMMYNRVLRVPATTRRLDASLTS